MVQHVGYYCPRCGVRYVAHACRDRKLPCQHSFEDAFYTYRWDYSEGFKRFKVANEKCGILFDVRYVDAEGLQNAINQYMLWLQYQVAHDNILLFVKNKTPFQVFQEACDNAGGRGFSFPPRHLWKELGIGVQTT